MSSRPANCLMQSRLQSWRANSPDNLADSALLLSDLLRGKQEVSNYCQSKELAQTGRCVEAHERPTDPIAPRLDHPGPAERCLFAGISRMGETARRANHALMAAPAVCLA